VIRFDSLASISCFYWLLYSDILIVQKDVKSVK
jgi:hypothetical protein